MTYQVSPSPTPKDPCAATQQRMAYVFPGQGSQWVGMGQDLYKSSPEAKAIFEEADSTLGFALSKLCFEGPEDVLRQTINAQPAIMTVSIAYLRASPLIKNAPRPVFLAGHSLGEYTALVAAGTVSFSDGLRLARERGRLMQEAGERVPGSMVAVIGLEESIVEGICQESGTQIANINCPGQIVISGTIQALEKATELARQRGAQRVIPLKVSGAFHSQLMQPAVEGMAQAISTLEFKEATIPIVANTTAQPVTSGKALKRELLDQLCHCVQWQKSVEWMIGQGITEFLEVGPGQVLTGLIKRINKEVRVSSTDTRK